MENHHGSEKIAQSHHRRRLRRHCGMVGLVANHRARSVRARFDIECRLSRHHHLSHPLDGDAIAGPAITALSSYIQEVKGKALAFGTFYHAGVAVNKGIGDGC